MYVKKKANEYWVNLKLQINCNNCSTPFPFQRIEVFVKQNNFLDALELALSFYNGTAMAVVGKL